MMVEATISAASSSITGYNHSNSNDISVSEQVWRAYVAEAKKTFKELASRKNDEDNNHKDDDDNNRYYKFIGSFL